MDLSKLIDVLQDFRGILEGYKTYFIGLLMIVVGLFLRIKFKEIYAVESFELIAMGLGFCGISAKINRGLK